ncbi:hypothetical protein ACLB2K_033171 [Fragaria x ananassa]
MAPKRPSPLDQPPAASSSQEEQDASSEEAASGSGSEESESETEASEPPKTTSTAKPQPKKPESAAAAKPQSSSSGETETDSESESDGENLGNRKVDVKPIASKPMEAVTPPPKATKPRSKPQASPATAKSGTKRPNGGESELNKDSKKAKKKGDDQEEDGVEEESSKKSNLFQRLWSDEDEIIILKGMNDYATKKGVDPYADMGAFHEFIKKSLKVDVSKVQLQDKIRRMRKKFENNVRKKHEPTKPHEKKTYELSKKVWGGGEDLAGNTEQPKANGKAKAKSNQKGNSKTLASMKADLLASPEPSKEAEKSGAMKRCASGSVSSEVIGFDKGFKELGLSETIVRQGLELIGGSKCAALKDKWNELHVAELELFVKRTELMRNQTQMILEAIKSDH